MTGWAIVLVCGVLGLALGEMLRRAPFWAHVVAFVVLPVGVTAYAAATGTEVTVFLMLKLWSVAVGSLLISTIRFHAWAQRPLAHRLIVGVLAVNILEAAVTEAFDGGRLNAAAGALLLLAQPFAASITLDGERRDLLYPVTRLWVAAYSVWNFTFIFGTAPPGHPPGEFSSLTLVHLGAPLLLMRGDGALFLQFRAYVLAFVVYAVVAFPAAMQVVPNLNQPGLTIVLRWLALGLSVGAVVQAALSAEGPRTTVRWLWARLSRASLAR